MKITAILACVLGVCVGFEDKTIVQWLNNTNGFSTLVTAINTAGLSQALSTTGPLTIFAPTDTAFARLGNNIINNLLKNKAQLTNMLKYHVLNEFLVVPMIKGDTKKDTLQSGQLDIMPYNGGLMVNSNAKVNSSYCDIIVNNGVIQPMDDILIPSTAPTLSISQLLLEDGRFTDFVLFVGYVHFMNTLADPDADFTLFAPVNSAFNHYKQQILQESAAPDALTFSQEMMKYHLVPGARTVQQLLSGHNITTLHGKSLNVTSTASGVMINNNATIIESNLVCTNGIVHVVDDILIAQDLGQIIANLG